MGTAKEVAAFVERIGKRLNESPRTSGSGKHRAAFIALRPLIEGALASGYTMKAAWATLHDERKLSMSYQTFRTHCRRAGIGRHVKAAPTTLRSEALPTASVVSRTAAPGPAETPQRGFRHERVPRKDDIYG